MNYIYKYINNPAITLEEANLMYKKHGYAVSCRNGVIVEVLKED